MRNTVNLSILCLGEYVFEQLESVEPDQENSSRDEKARE